MSRSIATVSLQAKREIPGNLTRCAAALAQRGFRIFPLRPNSKKPLVENWPEEATDDRWSVESWWGETPEANIGLVPQLALDFDCKPGQRGAESLDMLKMMGLPDTWTIKTPSGGLHMIYSLSAGIEVPNSASKIAKNVDVRGARGYVVAAGSTIDGKHYEGDDTPVVPAPLWLIEMCGRPREKAADNQTPAIELDTKAALKNARQWLERTAPEAVEGAGGELATLKVAMRVKDFGVSQAHCFDLMCKHWNEQKASPPWLPEDLAVKVFNAYAYGSRAPGALSAEAEFEDVSHLVGTTSVAQANVNRPNRDLHFVTFDDGCARALTVRTKPLIKGLLDAGAMSIIYGESNSGKSFIALDMSYHVAAGVPWNNRKTEQGLVIYVAAEGGSGIYNRLSAIAHHRGLDAAACAALPLAIVPCPVDLLRTGTSGDTDRLLALIADVEKRYARKATLIVIDTLSRAIAGGDENASTDMGAIVRNFDRIRTTTGAHLLVVHHSGKDKARGARGHSLLRAATDTELEVDNRTLTTTKQRELDAGKPIQFRLVQVEIGKDDDGERATSCVVEIRNAEDFAPLPLTGAESTAYGLLKQAVVAAAGGEEKAFSFAFKTKFAIDAMTVRDSVIGQSRSNLNDLLTALADKGAVKKLKRSQWIMQDVGNDGE